MSTIQGNIEIVLLIIVNDFIINNNWAWWGVIHAIFLWGNFCNKIEKKYIFFIFKMLSFCREVFFRCGSVQAGGASSRHHHDRRSRHQGHWSPGSTQQVVHHPSGSSLVYWHRQVVTNKSKVLRRVMLTHAVPLLQEKKYHWNNIVCRYNLDPFGNYTDEAIWEALKKTYIKDSVWWLLT